MDILPVITPEEEKLGKAIVDIAFVIHKELGPGLLEKIYERCFCYELDRRGIDYERQISLPFKYKGILFSEGLRADILVNNMIICELKAREQLNELWKAQLISHLKLTGLKLGYLINFNVPLIKYGIKRIVV